MFCVFIALYGSTVLIPQLLQTLMGYSATYAGFVLSPAGLVTMAVLPVVGFLLNRKVDARLLITFGLMVTAAAMYLMSGLTLGANPGTFIKLRMVQSFGMGFLWVPINTAAYLYIRQEQTSNAAGLFNLVRNEGASFGVAFVTTMLARRGQFHVSRLVEHINPLNPISNEVIDQLRAAAEMQTGDPVAANMQVWASVSRLVQQQAALLSYIDLFSVFMWIAIAVMPLVLLMRKSVAKGGPAVH
jgi:DHA2 family multidrug resistance protein